MHTCARKLFIRLTVPFCFLFLCVAPAHAALSASPNSVDFGNLRMGRTTSVPVTLTNDANGHAFTIVSITTSTSQFTVSGVSVPATIAPGASLTVNLTFAPNAVTNFFDTLSFTTYYGWTISVPLSGVGVQSWTRRGTSTSSGSTQSSGASSSSQSSPAPASGQLTVSPSLNFGTVPVGATGQQVFNITDSGSATVTVSNIALAGPNLSFTGLWVGLVLSPGQTISVTASYSPSSAGNASGTVTISSDAANSPSTLSWSASTATAPAPAAATPTVDLSWTASSSDGVTGYNVYRGTVSGGPYNLITSSPVAATAFLDSA
ncbi:MAG TPA: choice-of-anchor D domain-containing protein, partial [Candidatus Acidoferrales bacterium]|nr:choice-of-anchor D domain-containing protein [Candidatus Acidoferrales bacterium]